MNPLRPSLWSLLLALLLSACQAPQAPPDRAPEKPRIERGEISSLSFAEFFALHASGQLLLLDARHPYFYRLGHIPGAIHLHAENCDPRIELLKPTLTQALAEGKTLTVYCSGFGCRDARTLSRHLARSGYPVSTFSGGWRAWQKAELPTELPPTTLPSEPPPTPEHP